MNDNINLDNIPSLDRKTLNIKHITNGSGFFKNTGYAKFYKQRMLDIYINTYTKEEIIQDTKIESGVINKYFYKYMKLSLDLNDSCVRTFSDKNKNQCIILLFNKKEHLNQNTIIMKSLYDMLNISTSLEIYKINHKRYYSLINHYLHEYEYAIIIRISVDKNIASNTKSAAKR